MRNNLVVLGFVVVFGMMAGIALAGAGVEMRIDVPFDFYMGDQMFPAGQYQFDMDHGERATGSTVFVWAPENAADRILSTVPGTDRTATMNRLVFNKYGKKLFLSTVTINGYKATLKVHNMERELRAALPQAPDIVTVAQK